MQLDELERVERVVLSMVTQAILDYLPESIAIFQRGRDDPKYIAEDVTRDAIESMGLCRTRDRDRMYGTGDVKKSMYVFVPEPVPVALMLDSKAEKPNGDSTATIQMSQTSMRVKMVRGKKGVDYPGDLEQTIRKGKMRYHVVTVIAKYIYGVQKDGCFLKHIIVACIPNGALQDRYNPTPEDSIWRPGRDSTAREENVRARLVFAWLKQKADWRVREIEVAP